MLITDKNEIVRLKLMYAGMFNGQIISFAEFTVSSEEMRRASFIAPNTPKLGSTYIAVLISNADNRSAVYYLEVDGEPYYLMNSSGHIPHYSSNDFDIKIIWTRMINGDKHNWW